MDVLGRSAVGHMPDWVVAEMPPGYQTRLAEIQRLWADLGEMDQIGRLLWQTGEPLSQAILTVFLALKCDAESTMEAVPHITVKLDAWRRLLLFVSGHEGTLQRKSTEIAQVFELLHQFAGDHDRIVLVTNGDRTLPPKDRRDTIAPDALAFMQRMGVNVLRTVDLFRLWRLSHEDQTRVRTYLERLQAQDGGAFLLPV